MTTESERNEVETVDDAFANPVLKTYLPSRHVYVPCLVLLLGLTMIVGGPLVGVVLRRSTEHSLRQRQSIKGTDSCFHQESGNQLCSDTYQMRVTLFEVDNADDVQTSNATPILREKGPYTFEAIPVHGNVAYTDDGVQFIQRQVQLQRACDNCDWDTHITILYDNALRTASPTELIEDILRREEAVVTLSTGNSNTKDPYRVLAYDGASQSVRHAVYEAKLFGDAYCSDDDIHVFDRWLETTVTLSPTTKTKQRGLEAQIHHLSDCETPTRDCQQAAWDVEGVIYTLPYWYLNNGTTLASPSSFVESHIWEVVIDKHYGYTLSTARSYQANYRINAFGDSFWAASHWMTVSTSLKEDDVEFIKTTLRKTRLGYILLDLMMTLAGVITVVVSVAVMCCTPAARKRLRLMALRARSRARDPRLNIGQFTSLGKFLQRQMRSKKTTQSSDASQGLPLSTQSVQKQEFDDVQSIPATTDRTV